MRTAAEPFSATGGLKLLEGNLGRSVIKVSAVPADKHVIEAPAQVFDAQEDLLHAFKAGKLEKDFVAVVRWQGPRANGMPELHKLTPPLAVLQGRGFKVALVTDGRMSGASGNVPAAIHVSPEALGGGPLAKVRDGDVIRLDAVAGTLQVLVPEAEWAARPLAERTPVAGRVARRGLRPQPVRRHAPQRDAPPKRAPAPGCETPGLAPERPALAGQSSVLADHPTDHRNGTTMNPLDLAGYGPVIPVIVIDRLEDAVPMAKALVAGGVRVLEVTLRTAAGLPAIEAIAREVPDAVVGAGTVRNAADAQAAHGAGAKFIVSPGYTQGGRRGLQRRWASRCCRACPPAARS